MGNKFFSDKENVNLGTASIIDARFPPIEKTAASVMVTTPIGPNKDSPNETNVFSFSFPLGTADT